MGTIKMTTKQTEATRRVVSAFYERAKESPVVPPPFLLQLNVVLAMIDDEIPFSQTELDIIEFVFDAYFSSFNDDDIDPQAEQAYAKVAGHFYFPEHWLDRTRKFAHVVDHEAPQQEPRLGF